MTVRTFMLVVGIAQLAATVCVSGELSESDEYVRAIRATPSKEHGGQVYRDSCEACHGAFGEGYPGGAVAAFPVIGGQHFRVLVLALERFRHGRNSTHGMQYFSDENRLTGAQGVADVAAYVAALRPASPAGVGTGLSLPNGARVYLRSCEHCHGSTGEGDAARPVPRLAGQHFSYLLGKLGVSAHGQPINAEHTSRLQMLNAADRIAMADYLSRLLRTEAHGD